MKKILIFSLTLCLLVSAVTCFAVSASAEEEIEVTVGQVFEWNDQSGELTTQRAWTRSNGVSPDGLWKYQFYAIEKGIYQDMVLASGGFFAWNNNPGSDDNGLGYARVRNYGANFHPGSKADAVKVFTCPSGGTIQISSTVARQSDLTAGGKATGSSFAIYVENRLVYPEQGNGEYLTLVSKNPQTIDVTVEVAKNERVRIHIGAIGDQGSDGVDMSNTITYKSVNDTVGEQASETTMVVTGFEDGKTNVKPPLKGDDDGGDRDLPVEDKGPSVGLIVGIAVGAVAVVGIAVAVVVVLKKKKQE